MMKKISMLSLLVASLSFGATAAEENEEVKEVPTVEVTNPDGAAPVTISEDAAKDEIKDEKTCKDKEKECDEEKMAEEEKVEEEKNSDSIKEN